MEFVESCDLCGSKNQKSFEMYECYNQTFHFVECECGLAFLNPRPSIEEIGMYYDGVYTTIHNIYKQPPMQRFLTRFLRYVLQVRYHSNKMAKYAVRLLFFPWELKWCKILANTHMEGISSIGRVLDVGCGRGYFLATIQRWGFQCFGCEPDPQAAKVAQDAGLEVVCSDLLNAPYSKNQFDVIRFSHVLEHVHFPSAVLQRANELVKPGGLIIVEVPNHVGIVAQSFRQTEDVPRHLYGFTPETLQRYFAQAGLRVTKTVTLTRKPHDIYGQFGRFALEFAKNATEEQKKKIADFWSPTNKRRVKEFEASAKFFDSIGRGSAVAVVGTKD